MSLLEHEPPAWMTVVPARLRTKFDREDLLQEVRARVFRAGPSLEGRTEAEKQAYVNKAARSVVLELVRNFDRDKRRTAHERALPPTLVSDHTSPGARAAKNEVLGRLADALAALPEDQRRALELKHVKALSLKETARRMGKTQPAVAGLLRRGLIDLRARLGAEA